MKEEKPVIAQNDDYKPPKRWQPSQPIQDLAVVSLKEIVPTMARASDARLEECYKKGCDLYSKGRYKNAIPYFQMCGISNAKDARYPLGLGACHHMMKQYNEAISFYTMSAYLDPDNPAVQYHIADCYMRKEEPVGAYINLRLALKSCQKNPKKFKTLGERITIMINSLEKEFEEKKEKGITKFRGGSEVRETRDQMEKKHEFKFGYKKPQG